MKKIIDYIPLISGCLIYFGFCHLYYFYQEFHIDIYSLISSTDILLSFFPRIVLITSLFYGAVFSQLFGTIRQPISNETNKDSSDNESVNPNRRVNWWRKNIPWFVFIYYLPANLLLLGIQKLYNYRPYELYNSNLIIDMIFMFLVWVAILIHENRSSILKQPIVIGICLIIFLGQKIGTYRKYDAQLIKNGISDFRDNHIAFSYADSTVKTNDSILYVGAISNYIFLYNLHDSSTTIYPISETKFLTVK